MEKVDCRKAAIEVCRNVPLYVHERTALPCDLHGKECPSHGAIEELWVMHSDEVVVPILNGAKVGEERAEYIAHLQQFALLFEEERAEDIEKVKQGQENAEKAE